MKKNLDVKLESGTSILNINYRDTNKDIILPALKKMSSIYQDYSGRKIRRSQQLTKEYLEDQIQLFRKKSSDSIKSAQNFAVDQNLNYLGSSSDFNNSIQQNDNGLNIKLDNSQPLFRGSIVNIENTRVQAANKIRMINLQIAHKIYWRNIFNKKTSFISMPCLSITQKENDIPYSYHL